MHDQINDVLLTCSPQKNRKTEPHGKPTNLRFCSVGRTQQQSRRVCLCGCWTVHRVPSKVKYRILSENWSSSAHAEKKNNNQRLATLTTYCCDIFFFLHMRIVYFRLDLMTPTSKNTLTFFPVTSHYWNVVVIWYHVLAEEICPPLLNQHNVIGHCGWRHPVAKPNSTTVFKLKNLAEGAGSQSSLTLTHLLYCK